MNNEQKSVLILVCALLVIIVLCILYLSGWFQHGIGLVNNPESTLFSSEGISFTCPAGWFLSTVGDVNNPHPVDLGNTLELNYFLEHSVNCFESGFVNVVWADKKIDLNKRIDERYQELIRVALPHTTTINSFSKSNLVFNGFSAVKADYSYTTDFGPSGIEPGGPVTTTYIGEIIVFNCGERSVVLSFDSLTSQKALNESFFGQIKNSFKCE